MYYNKYLKYKIKYNDKIKKIIKTSYKQINSVLNNLDKYYNKIKYFKQSGGEIKDYNKLISPFKLIINYYMVIIKFLNLFIRLGLYY